MTIEEWNEQYKPVIQYEINSKIIENKNLYREALEGLVKVYNTNIWSVIEEDGEEYLVEGRRGLANVVRYIVCEVPNELDETTKIKYKQYEQINKPS